MGALVRFGSIYRQLCSMNRRFQLTCLCCALKIHHNTKYRQTKGTLSLWLNHYCSIFCHFSPAKPFRWGELLCHDMTIFSIFKFSGNAHSQAILVFNCIVKKDYHWERVANPNLNCCLQMVPNDFTHAY